ncbi:uncharacterized protein LOC117319124 [Pecten maximus]|uniref:uncharacterized protein LOC117319124 n=1 Tax=Pecten maximus TaxID=6579 RepID=UPI001458F7A9|nr:uncharacterized protein LOC117319124 [Pecten maximus]
MAEDEIVPLLAEGDNQENITPGCISGATCQESTETRPDIILPNGKEYHIFISFTSGDRPYVMRLNNALDVMGFKCMLAEDDFISGVPIMQNIQTFIEKSHKLLLVVSEAFLQKPFCNWEVEIGHKYAADNNRNDYMIVLRLDECEMPLKLGYMTNIYGVGREVEDVALKVKDAFFNRAEDPISQSQNGCEILRMSPTEISQRLCCSSGYQFNDIPASEEYRLGCYSMKESAEFYREMMKCANDHSLIKRYAVFSRSRKSWYFFVLFLCGIQAVFTSIYLLVTQLSGNDLSISQLLLLSLAWLILAVCLYIALLKYLYRQVCILLTKTLFLKDALKRESKNNK